MDRRRLLFGTLLALPLVGAVARYAWPTDDEAAIRALLDALCAAVHVDPSEGNPLARAARVHDAFSKTVSENVVVDIPDFPQVTSGRRPLADLATQAGLAFHDATVTLSAVTLRMAPSKKSCEVEATATLTATGSGLQRDTREVTLRVDKIDGTWRVASIGVTARREGSDG
jgi:hypothetical protein